MCKLKKKEKKEEGTNSNGTGNAYLVDKEHIKLKRDWVGQVYYASFSSNS